MTTTMETIKLVVIGDEDVGKTCMLMSYTTKKFPTDYVPTIHDGYAQSLMVDGKPYCLGLFDTGGEEKYAQLRPLSYPQTDVFLVCFSVALPTSFDNVKKKYIPEIMASSAREAPFLIVGTQMDLRDDAETIERLAKMGQKPISFEMGQNLAEELKAVKYIECSALTLEGVENVLHQVMAAALRKPPEKKKTQMTTIESIKLVVIGDEDVGKTCMLMSYTTKKFPTDYVPTVHEHYSQNMTFDGKPCNLELWDTAGEEKFDRIRPLSYPQTDVFLVCFSVALPTSFDNVKKKHLPEIMASSASEAPFLIVGTQVDLRDDAETIEKLAKMDQKPISFEMGQNLAEELKAVKYVECSALTLEGVNNVLHEAIAPALHKPPE